MALPNGRFSCGRYLENEDSGVLKGKLCFFVPVNHDKQCHIWVMNDYGVDESWAKLMVLQHEGTLVGCTERNLVGCTANAVTRIVRQLYGDGKSTFLYVVKMRMEHAEYVIVDNETSYEKLVEIRHFPIISTFQESLVWLDGASVECGHES